ncbi:hypothetical protein [Gemmata sp.]|uniref:hypothetical protein n=1 Tax=Gemmata sp. TaxID=1914242 RepID=UPI003F710CD2
MNEAETCRTMVWPELEGTGWLANGERFYREQMHVTNGRIVLADGNPKRQRRKIPDFLLHFTRDLRIYGRLDCNSAVAALGKGYSRHRVFFADEAAGIAAGYRPCGNCFRARNKV